MSVPIPTAPQKPSLGGRILFWISCIVSLGLLGYLIRGCPPDARAAASSATGECPGCSAP